MNIDDELQSLIFDVNEMSKEIPFGNSSFQNLKFVLGNEMTSGRAVRHCLLRLNNRISALRDCYYNLELEKIDIEEMQFKLEYEINEYEKRRITVKLEQKIANKPSLEKLIDDCLEEIRFLYSVLKSLPTYTRERFELEEEKHFRLKLGRDAKIALEYGQAAGCLTSLDNMGLRSQFIDSIKDGTLEIEMKKEIENINMLLSEKKQIQ